MMSLELMPTRPWQIKDQGQLFTKITSNAFLQLVIANHGLLEVPNNHLDLCHAAVHFFFHPDQLIPSSSSADSVVIHIHAV